MRWIAKLSALMIGLGVLGSACAPPVLATQGSPCVLPEALQIAGDRSAAHAAYLKVLTADPASRCAKLGIEKTDPKTSFWTSVGQVAENTGKSLALLVLLALVLVALALLWLNFQTRVPWLRDRWPAKKIRRPTLQIANFNDGALTDRLGPPIAGLIRGKVNWRRKDRYGPNLVSGQAGIASTLESLGDISSETKGAVAVVKLLTATLPRRRFVLGGEIQPAGSQGPGISLELKIEDGYDSLVTFWASPLGLSGVDSPAVYQHLAIVAAAWVDHRTVNAMDGGNLLTADPQSWALFSSGVEWQRQGEYRIARELYEQALISDGDNVGALANLGIIEKYEKNFKEAERLFLRALSPIENPERAPKLASDENPDWYRIKYQLAGLYANWAVATDEPIELKRSRKAQAADRARDLALTTSQTIEGLSGQAPAPALLQFLEGTIEPDALILAASTIPESGATERPATRPQRSEVISTLKAERIDPWILIAFVEHGSNRSSDTSYNLACFYSMQGEFMHATEHLLSAVREVPRSARPALVKGMTLDPTLAPLLQRLPGLLVKLEVEAGDGPEEGDGEEEVACFDLEYEAIQWLESQGWAVDWAAKDAGFTLIGKRDSRSLLALVEQADISQEGVDALIGARERFTQHSSRDGEFETAWIAPASKLPPACSDAAVTAAVSQAWHYNIAVYGAGDQGFVLIKS